MFPVHDVYTDNRTVSPSVHMKRERRAASVVVRKVGVLEKKIFLYCLNVMKELGSVAMSETTRPPTGVTSQKTGIIELLLVVLVN